MLRKVTEILGFTGSCNSQRNVSKKRKKRNQFRRNLQFESLQQRELMAADLVGIARGDEILLNTDYDPSHEIDLSYQSYGERSLQTRVVGDWDGSGSDELGVAKDSHDGYKHWQLQTNSDPHPEIDYIFGLHGDTPVVGNWDGVGGDNVGVARDGHDGLIHWYLDTNTDPMPEMEFSFGLNGDTPVTGDWNGDGKTDIGVVRQGVDGFMRWYLNWDDDAWPEDEYVFGLNGDQPVVGDWNGDGKDDVGVVRTNEWGFLNWYQNTNRDALPEHRVDFGARGDVPLVGKWHAPEISVSTTTLHFSNSVVGDKSPVRDVTIANEGNAVLTLSVAQLPAGFHFVTTPPTNVQPGSKVSFSIAMPTSASGSYSGDLVLATNDGNESHLTVSLKGVVHSGVSVGGTLTGGSPLACDSGGVTTTTKPTPVIDIIDQTQSSGPQITGGHGGVVTFGSGSTVTAGPDLHVSLSGRYVKDGKIDFNGIVGADNPTQHIVIKNRGQQDLVISDLQLPPGYKVVGIRDGQQIAPHGQAVIQITPDRNLGVKIGTLRFTTNDPKDGVFSVELRAKRYERNVNYFSFGSHPIHAPGQFNLNITTEVTQIEVAPAHGRSPVGTMFEVILHTRNGYRTLHFSSLTELQLRGPFASTIPVENWTSVRVKRA